MLSYHLVRSNVQRGEVVKSYSHRGVDLVATIMGNVIPAGWGMKDAQLLVVDRKNHKRICGAGEIGEIYVRAGGLAEGYLGTEKMSWMVPRKADQ